jgi:hypothetical protein
MKQEFEIFEGYNLNVTNYCHCKGHYYSEDDWNIDVFGDTLDDVVKKFWIDEFPLVDLDIDKISFSKIIYLIYKGNRIILESEKITDARNIQHLFYIDEYSKIGRQKKEALQEEEKIQEEEERKKQQIEKELRILQELKSKYPDN